MPKGGGWQPWCGTYIILIKLACKTNQSALRIEISLIKFSDAGKYSIQVLLKGCLLSSVSAHAFSKKVLSNLCRFNDKEVSDLIDPLKEGAASKKEKSLEKFQARFLTVPHNSQ